MKEMEINNIHENEHEEEIPKRRALGRGLEELFSSEVLDYSSVEKQIVEETSKDEIVNIKLSELRSNPYQPRKIFDEKALEELANSIKEHGVFQPIIVKKSIKCFDKVIIGIAHNTEKKDRVSCRQETLSCFGNAL